MLAVLEVVAATPPPAGVRELEQLRERLNGWDLVAEDPEPLLSTGLCSGEWLGSGLAALREAAAGCDLSGGAFVHLDVRSDNVCFRQDSVLLVDWNLACVGNPLVDVVGWLSTCGWKADRSRGRSSPTAAAWQRSSPATSPPAPACRRRRRRRGYGRFSLRRRRSPFPGPLASWAYRPFRSK